MRLEGNKRKRKKVREEQGREGRGREEDKLAFPPQAKRLPAGLQLFSLLQRDNGVVPSSLANIASTLQHSNIPGPKIPALQKLQFFRFLGVATNIGQVAFTWEIGTLYQWMK